MLAAALLFLAQVPGPQVLTFFSPVDDTDQPYGLYLPKDYNEAKKWPLVISLHGATSNHRLNLRRVFGQGNRAGESDSEATRYWPAMKDIGMIVATPLARGTMGYQGIAEDDVYRVLDDVKKRFSIDEDRVYLTGLSMGGGGSLWLSLTKPDVWAAVAAVCPAPPLGTDALAGNAINLPVKLFQGDQDPLVPVAQTRRWAETLLKLGVRGEYVEYPGVRHNSWDKAYADGAIFDWFAPLKRERDPERVRYASANPRYRAAYWVELDSFTPGTLASVDAVRKGATVEITTANLDGFTLKRKAGRVVVDGQTLNPKSMSGSRSFTLVNGKWREGRAPAPSKWKGPIGEVTAKRHIYVYGTADDPSSEELARRRAEAQGLTNWAIVPRQPLLLTLLAMADREVTEKELAQSNLVLLGDARTNSWIAKYGADLPLTLKPGAADYTLVTITRTRDREIAVVTGKPISFAPRPFTPNPLANDYVLLRAGETVASGFFTRDWKPTQTLPDVVEVH